MTPHTCEKKYEIGDFVKLSCSIVGKVVQVGEIQYCDIMGKYTYSKWKHILERASEIEEATVLVMED